MSETTGNGITIREAVEQHAMELARRVWPSAPADDLSSPEDAPWFAIETEPQQETLAAGHLIGRRFDAYLPAEAIYAKRGRSMQWRTMPMFRGYLFLRVAVERLTLSVARIQSLPGVKAFVRMAGGDGHLDLAAIDPEDMLRIRLREAHSFERKRVALSRRHQPYGGGLEPGDKVRITEGPFESFTGEVQDIRDGDSATILVEIFGRATPVTVTPYALVAA